MFDITFSQTTNGYGFRCDVLDDTVGSALITMGVFRLGAVAVHGRYARVMGFVKVVAVLKVLDTAQAHFIRPLHPAVQFALQAFGLVTLAALIGFCVAMRWFCEKAGLAEAARSWRGTTLLFAVLYAVPLGLLYVAGAVAAVSGTSFHLDIGPLIVLVLAVVAIPLVHLFVSTSRMKRAAEVVPSVESPLDAEEP